VRTTRSITPESKLWDFFIASAAASIWRADAAPLRDQLAQIIADLVYLIKAFELPTQAFELFLCEPMTVDRRRPVIVARLHA
jgi:hypothetical protein